MRWPFMNWLRGAPGRDDPAPGASEAVPPPASPPAAPDQGPGPRVATRPAAWRDLPPVQRATGAPPLTAPSAAFVRDLAGRHSPDPMLAPLGHDVTVDGPAGLVSGIAVPLVQRTRPGSDAAAAPALPAHAAPGRSRSTAQRTVTSVASAPPGGGAGNRPGDAGDLPVAEADTAARPGPTASEPIPDLPGLALRALPVARLATATTGIAATRVADATAPGPAQARARVVAPAPPVPPGGGAVTPGSAAAAAIVPDGAIATDPAPGAPPDTAAVTPPALGRADDSTHPVVARRSLGESRRLGLGAPIVGPPPSVARETGRSDLPVARRARAGDATLPTSAHLPPAPAVEPAAAASSPLPRLVVARRSAASPVTTTAPGRAGEPAPVSSQAPAGVDSAGDLARTGPSTVSGSDTADEAAAVEPAAVEPAAGDASSLTRPLVGEAPIGVARLARDGPGTDADSGMAAEPGADPLRRTTTSSVVPDAGGPEVAPGPGGSRAVTADRPGGVDAPSLPAGAAVQRTGAGSGVVLRSSPPPPSDAPRIAPAMAPLVAARAMRSEAMPSIVTLGHGLAEQPAPVIARLAVPPADSPVDAADRRPAAVFPGGPWAPSAPGVARREERPVVARLAPAEGRGATSAGVSPLAFVRPATGPAATDGSPARRRGGAVGWTPEAGFTAVDETHVPFVQRAVEINELDVSPDVPPAGGAESGAAVAGQTGAAGAAAAGSGGPRPDYDELAEHVYDRIRARISTELLLDRERAGTLVDG